MSRRPLRFALGALALATLTGCASAPSGAADGAAPPPPPPTHSPPSGAPLEVRIVQLHELCPGKPEPRSSGMAVTEITSAEAFRNSLRCDATDVDFSKERIVLVPFHGEQYAARLHGVHDEPDAVVVDAEVKHACSGMNLSNLRGRWILRMPAGEKPVRVAWRPQPPMNCGNLP